MTASPSATLLRVKSRETLILSETILRIGRDPSCALRVNDRHASRVHAEIRRQGDAYVLHDLSVNGTWVNGLRVQGQQKLVDGDQIRVARERFVFTTGAETGPKAEPEVSPSEGTVPVDVVPAPRLPAFSGGTDSGEQIPFHRRRFEHPLQAWLYVGAGVVLAAALLLLVLHWAS